MNDQTRSIVALSLIAGVTLGQPIFEIAKTLRKMRKDSKGIQLNSELDTLALLRTAEVFKVQIADGAFEHLTHEEMMRLYMTRFEFEKIAIRLEQN